MGKARLVLLPHMGCLGGGVSPAIPRQIPSQPCGLQEVWWDLTFPPHVLPHHTQSCVSCGGAGREMRW